MKVSCPKYSVLENRALKLLRLNSFRLWEEGLRVYLKARTSGELVDKHP